MFLIQSDPELRRYFPNVFSAAPGEKTFYQRLEPHLQAAEDWLDTNIVPVSLMEEKVDEIINSYPGILSSAKRLVVAFALHSAAPSLDLKLDANGFATVGTNNLVPISTQRMERLMRSLASTVDNCIDDMLKHLHNLSGWSDTEQGRFFARSVFQNLDLCTLAPSDSTYTPSELVRFPMFERFLSLRAKAVEIEAVLEDYYFSPDLMNNLRRRIIDRKLQVDDVNLLTGIRTEILRSMRGEILSDYRLRTLVNFVRNSPESFPEWQSSKVAALFNDDSFKNEKESSGYWW